MITAVVLYLVSIALAFARSGALDYARNLFGGFFCVPFRSDTEIRDFAHSMPM
jgi:hypothetical protein